MNDEQENASWCQALYEDKAAGLILYGRALGLSHSESEDVLQETFLALLRMEEVPEDPVHYCMRSFRNRAMNYHRSVWRRLTRELESANWFESGATDTEAQAEAVQCLQTIPSEQREVIVLKIWNEMTFEAIGRLLEASPNTVAGRYRYGMTKLRALLKGKAYESAKSIGKAVAVLDPASSLE